MNGRNYDRLRAPRFFQLNRQNRDFPARRRRRDATAAPEAVLATLYFLQLTNRPVKLECLSLADLSNLV
jgi:hypothetical protein